MASVSSPYGLVPISHQSGTVRTVRMPGGIASGFSGNIFKYQPIKLVAGSIQPITAATDQIFGVFAGVEFTPTGGRPGEFNFWPGGSTYQVSGGVPTYDMWVYYWNAWDDTLRYQIQADGAVSQALMGSQFNFTNIGAGNTFTGLSAMTVGAAGVAVGLSGQVFLTEFFTGVNDPVNGGDAFTDLIVGIALNQVGSGSDPSIG